jgi:hypothetical protein
MINGRTIFIAVYLLVSASPVFGQNDERRFPIHENGRWGYIDITGNVVMKPQFDYACDFSEGLAAIQLGTEYYRVPRDKSLQPEKITKAEAESLSECDGELDIHEGKFGYINTCGEMVISLLYDNALEFSEGLAAVNVGEKFGCCGEFYPGSWGYIDRSGDTVIALQFDFAGDFSEGLAHVESGRQSGFIDKGGKYVIIIDAMRLENFKNGFAAFDNEKEYGYIDKSGKRYPGPIRKTAGLKIFMKNDRYGYSDTLGNIIVRPRFEYADLFVEGKARVKLFDKWGFVDKRGALVCQPTYDYVFDFADGMARVEKNGLIGYVDANCNLAVVPQFKEASDFHNGLAAITKNHFLTAYIDKTGRYVWRDTK